LGEGFLGIKATEHSGCLTGKFSRPRKLGVDQAQAEALVAEAHTICPYSKATRGNIEVKLQANGNALQQAA
jgi:hypothetical protein